MNNQKEHLDNLSEIRTLMERSSRFLSLSGISGISAGLIAILGITVASIFQGYSFFERTKVVNILDPSGGINREFMLFFTIDAIIIIILAIGASVFFTMRKAKKRKLPVWDSSAIRRLFLNFFFCQKILNNKHQITNNNKTSMFEIPNLTAVRQAF